MCVLLYVGNYNWFLVSWFSTVKVHLSLIYCVPFIRRCTLDERVRLEKQLREKINWTVLNIWIALSRFSKAGFRRLISFCIMLSNWTCQIGKDMYKRNTYKSSLHANMLTFDQWFWITFSEPQILTFWDEMILFCHQLYLVPSVDCLFECRVHPYWKSGICIPWWVLSTEGQNLLTLSRILTLMRYTFQVESWDIFQVP